MAAGTRCNKHTGTRRCRALRAKVKIVNFILKGMERLSVILSKRVCPQELESSLKDERRHRDIAE